MTLAVNAGYATATSEKAARAWNARRDARTPSTQSVAEYRATAARLAARFPDNVKVH